MNRINDSNRYLFEELSERIREQSGAAGIAVAIVDEAGGTQYEQYFGFRDKEQKLPIDQDTIFGLASVTKSFVALSVMQLAERGVISLEDPVSKYIPEFTNKNQEPVKIWHFLCHSGGFYPLTRTVVDPVAKELGLDEERDGDLAYNERLAVAGAKIVAGQLDAQTPGRGLIGRPGQYMSYCNDGFGLLSDIVRRVGGEPSFAEYVEKNILSPLGMERSGCGFVRPRTDENAALLYKKRDGVMTVSRDFHDHAFVLNGAGAMKSTLADMQKYIAMYLNHGRSPEGTRLLTLEGVRAMCRPRMEYRPDSYYCYGLAAKKLDDLTVVEHGGSLTGVSSNMSWSYDAGAGVIVLCNTSDVPVSVIADAAMRMYCGRNPVDSRDTYRETEWSDRVKRAACGHYHSLEGEDMEISLENGRVKLCSDGEEKKFVTVQERLGIIRGKNKDGYLSLHMDEDGNVFAVGFGGRMIPRV